jgi:hypothetical protein
VFLKLAKLWERQAKGPAPSKRADADGPQAKAGEPRH